MMPREELQPVSISLVGDGERADAWARGLRAEDAVTLQRVTQDEASTLGDAPSDARAALVIVPPLPDLPGLVRRALLARRDVFVAGTPPLHAAQIQALAASARSRGRLLVFDGGYLADDRIAFVRKMVAGPQALWRPRYVRAVRASGDNAASLDELALSAIGFVLSVLGGSPAQVSALAPRVDDETGAADVALITVGMDGGPAAGIDVSLVEAEARDEVVIACDGRTIVLDALDRRAPLRIEAAGRHRAPRRASSWSETVSEHPAAEPRDRIGLAASAFVSAVRARDVALANSDELALAASVWEAARTSMTRGGEMVAVADEAASSRPALKVIRGNGRRDDSHPAPALTVVSRSEAPDTPRIA